MTNITICGNVDQRAIDQLTRCAETGNSPRAALCADGHVGYSQPIGGVVAYEDYISPSGVGYDIACGNKAVATNLLYSDISGDIHGIMDEIAKRISFGIGRNNNEPIEHPVIDKIHRDAPFDKIRVLTKKAENQLGTVGAGNHYVDLFREQKTDRIWIGVHFGSRGFGHTIASGFLALAQGLEFDERAKEGEMDSPPVLFHIDSPLAHNYIESMTLAGEYAYAGRDIVCLKVLEILGAESMKEIHNHHNFAWKENHAGNDVWVIRKGCTPAFPGQEGFVGATMGEPSVILSGAKESNKSRDLLFSTVHGAGRVMSRTQAAGKIKRRKTWECSNRDCNYTVLNGPDAEKGCPDHPDSRLNKRTKKEQVKAGLVDFVSVKQNLKNKHIELRGGGADEAPEAYKRLGDVLEFHKDTVEILHTLIPIGVAMAGEDVYDPFKD
jgi:tRNA-splicing ligase RtcB